MAEYGISTWDANGNYNNYGIKPSVVVGMFSLSTGQVSGSYTFNVPSGYKLSYAISLDEGSSAGDRRKITIAGNTVTISNAGASIGADIWPTTKCDVIVFLETA
nr:outer membrane protein [Escherichia phage morffagbaw]